MTISEMAIRVASYSDVRKAKLAAIAFSHSGNIIATAHNRKVFGVKDKFTQHAEEVLLLKLHKLKAFDRFRNITILVIRINSHGISMAKPCKNCRKLLERHNINVLYSDWNGKICPM